MYASMALRMCSDKLKPVAFDNVLRHFNCSSVKWILVRFMAPFYTPLQDEIKAVIA
jgi:hypothetical protein